MGKQSAYFSADKTADEINGGYTRLRVSLAIKAPRRHSAVDTKLEYRTSSMGKGAISIILQ